MRTLQRDYRSNSYKHAFSNGAVDSSELQQQHYSIKAWNKSDALHEYSLGRHASTSPSSASHCARSFANRQTKSRKNIRRSRLSEDTYNIIQLKAAAKCRDLRSFEIRFEFESAVTIRFDSTVMGRFENFRIGRVCPLLVVVRRLKRINGA